MLATLGIAAGIALVVFDLESTKPADFHPAAIAKYPGHAIDKTD